MGDSATFGIYLALVPRSEYVGFIRLVPSMSDSSNIHNPSLTEQPRYQVADVLPSQQQPSILDWLENSGRLLAREPHEADDYSDEEITELMSGEDSSYQDEEAEEPAEER